MQKFAFISRHEPTQEQINLAAEQEIEFVYVGDADAFTVDAGFVDHAGTFDGVVVVHPAAALRLCPDFLIGIFEPKKRSEVGLATEAKFKAFHVYNLVG